MWCYWTAKGGSGCSVVAAAAALLAASERTADRSVLLVDLGGDLAGLLNVDPGPLPGVGIRSWLETEQPPPDALFRLEVEAGPGLRLLPWDAPGPELAAPHSGVSAERTELLAHLLAGDPRTVVVDIGLRSPHHHPSRSRLIEHLMALSTRSVLVTRLCYLSLRVARAWPRPDDIALITEPGRVFRPADVAGALGHDLVLTAIRWDPAVARAVDTGLLTQRLPRPLRAVPRPTVGLQAETAR